LKKQARVFIQMGPGGVGKTTVSAAFGFYWAKQGYKVLVMTIDPSKRLAQALGIQGRQGVARVPVDLPKGELSAMLLDHSEIFDSFVRRAAQKNPMAERLFQNKLYQALKTRLQGTQDFTALIELYERATSGEFDIVVLDTPPAQHAWQFLEAPEKLATLFQDKVAKWFRWLGGSDENPSLWSKMINVGTQQVLKALEILTGEEFVLQIADFFRGMQSFQTQLFDKIIASRDLLESSHTEFTLVTTQDELKIKESLEYAQEMKSRGYHLKRVLINRAWPENLQADLKGYEGWQKQEIETLLNLLGSHQESNQKLLKNWPRGVKVLKVYDTLKSSHDLERLQQMADDMLKAFE